MIKTYYMLTKPGIILGNLITTAAGFILASKGPIDIVLFLVTLLGLALVIASGCICNNYLDRKADAKMKRTKNRALVKKLISPQKAIFFAAFLGILGVFVLGFFTNLLATLIAIAGFLIYVILYGILKYKSIHGTLIGSLSGAVPPVIGYVAVSNQLDLGALLLFMIVVLWQMPHFFAIAIYRYDDYKAASIPVLPTKKGIKTTKVNMLFYLIAFIIVSALLTVFGYTGLTYLGITTILGLIWLFLCLQGFKAKNNILWARKMFVFSLIMITVQCIAMSLDVIKQ